jgi:poly-gamma-glutamate synthesis protein (capsule biosynthesis protein)
MLGGVFHDRRSTGTSRLLAVMLAMGLAAGLAAACGSGSATPSAGTVTDPITFPPASPTPTPTPTPDKPVTIAFAGDVHFAGRVAQRLADPRTALGPISQTLSQADVAMVNLETALTTRGTPEPKSFHFRAPPGALDALRDAGVDVATMANNHGVDYGPVGLTDTMAAITASGFPVVGIGQDSTQAYAPWYTTVRGNRVAIIGASEIPDRTLTAWTAEPDHPGVASAFSARLIASVKDARTKADIVVVYLHWGQEGKACPISNQPVLAKELAAAGADAVVGTHAHLLLGGGWMGPTYVAYGLGNFLWWRDNAFSNDTGVLTLSFDGRRVTAAHFTPAEIDNRGVPMPASGAEASRINAKWNDVRVCTGLSGTPPK